MLNPIFPVQVEGWPGVVRIDDNPHSQVPESVLEGSRRLTLRSFPVGREDIGCITDDQLWAKTA